MKHDLTEFSVIDDDGEGRKVKRKGGGREDGREAKMEMIVVEDTSDEEDTNSRGKTEMKRRDEGIEGGTNKENDGNIRYIRGGSEIEGTTDDMERKEE